MANIRDYIFISAPASTINEIYSDPQNFTKKYWEIKIQERSSFIRHFIVNNKPFAFKDHAILYEQITQYIADKFKIKPEEVKLIGSAKTGFSISPPPGYGRSFGAHSDLDFSIINEEIFNKLKIEYSVWKDQFTSSAINPHSETERKYWLSNVETGANQIRRGFIDTNKIPNRESFKTTMEINNSMYLINSNINKYHPIKIKKTTASIYQNWNTFHQRLERNTNNILLKINPK